MRAAIIAAAGSGRRFGKRKQFERLFGRSVLEWAVLPFEKSPLVDSIVVVAPPDAIEDVKDLLRDFKKLTAVVCGGPERQNSVFNGLRAVDKNCKQVFIHDGARPVVFPEFLNRLVVAIEDYLCEGVVLAVKPKETVKELGAELEEGDFVVKKTLCREKLALSQTPQLFEFKTLLLCHERAAEEEFLGTDDASLLERYGYTVISIEGDYRNIKITTPEDAKVAEVFLKEFF